MPAVTTGSPSQGRDPSTTSSKHNAHHVRTATPLVKHKAHCAQLLYFWNRLRIWWTPGKSQEKAAKMNVFPMLVLLWEIKPWLALKRLNPCIFHGDFFEDVSIWKWEKWSPSCIFFWGSWPKETRNQWSACAHLRTKCRARAGGIKGPQWPKDLRTSRNKGPNKPNHQHAKLTSLPETQKNLGEMQPPHLQITINNHVSLPKPGPSHSCHRHHGQGWTHKWRACVSHVSCCFKSHGFDVAMRVKKLQCQFQEVEKRVTFSYFSKEI